MPLVFTVNATETNISYEAETVEEGMAIRTSAEMMAALAKLGELEGTPNTESAPAGPDNTTSAARRTRGPNKPKNQPAPETATAPPPAPIPTSVPVPPPAPIPTAPPVPPVPPLATAPIDTTIPPFLKREEAPPAPPAPPAPVAPSIILGPKVRAYIEGQAGDDPTKQKQWIEWLANSSIVIPGVKWEEAMGVLQFTTDPQCAGVAKALGVSA